MQLFLASCFDVVAELFPEFLAVELDDLQGKTVTFINTAGNVEANTDYLADDRAALETLGLKVDELDIATAEAEEIESKITQNDMIFVAGGNTFYLLQELQRTDAGQIIEEAVRAGKPYIGSSAGSIIAAQNIEYVKQMDDPKQAPTLGSFRALDLVKVYPLPHYKCPPFTRSSRITYREYAPQIDLVTLNDEQVLIVDDERAEVWNI